MSFFYIRMMFHAFRWRYILKLGLQDKSSCYVILVYWNDIPFIQKKIISLDDLFNKQIIRFSFVYIAVPHFEYIAYVHLNYQEWSVVVLPYLETFALHFDPAFQVKMFLSLIMCFHSWLLPVASVSLPSSTLTSHHVAYP